MALLEMLSIPCAAVNSMQTNNSGHSRAKFRSTTDVNLFSPANLGGENKLGRNKLTGGRTLQPQQRFT
jgi:hypothetical protein